ncbi:DUF2809 domain-containing protein [Microbacterium sp. Bi128]|uniref:DUF2809 domain-containing protein n=1 Tax=Microbacterium sp. Bi128 TaxID=2821115 RepID=UPI001D32CC7A|nr:DUF2809 domain-containing protein [Microbacterium sp. Bi128]CAH0243027.1 hypothetical protein SRABI128_02728 [Microbacterium sp. Bi128]
MTEVSRRRIAAGAALLAVVAAGLTVHAAPGSVVTDIVGDALYTVAVYAGLVMLLPRVRPVVLAAVAAAWCVGVELLQLTGLPAAWADAFPPIALVLGLGFDARDLLVSLAAAAVAVGVDLAVRRRLFPRGERPRSPSRRG